MLCDRVLSGVALLGLCGFLGQPMAQAFDTGHHADLTKDVLTDYSFNRNAIEVAQVENWLVDYYSSQPAAGLKDELALLHFDNLFTDAQVQSYWNHLTTNTQVAVQAAARENDPLKLLALLGMSLHVVQDFYTHSNWPTLYPPQKGTYRTNTWFSTASPQGVFTGRYDRAGSQPEHGSYDFGLNQDSYNRPQWDQAYVFAYAASHEWVAQIRDWVQAVNPPVWNRALGLQLSAQHRQQLDQDLEAAYRISEWIDVGDEEGHWKGRGSGSNAEFVAFTAQWTARADSIFVNHFKEKRWFAQLLPGLNGQAPTPPTVPTVQARPIHKTAVLVRTLQVAEEPVGLLESRIDPGGAADFFARITIQGQTFVEAMQLDRRQINPDWIALKMIDSTQTQVPIRYELWDEDGGLRSDDDPIDINPQAGYGLDLVLNPKTRSLSGDIQGVHDSIPSAVTTRGNERDRASLKFFVTTRPLDRATASTSDSSPTPLSNPLPEIFRILDPLLK
ncbi:hypothetical protein [Lyngbya confervoides]|uniref:Phospholipase C/D domain-containing protein n=1 Tax=Lyngbya confervoides BDU141951 TaxID=1574623 RepID=A0ABD4T7P7_9CYAN|nr:hypothetical protein [Lyngbya confervoides]MCM1984493.1 hypothetical protein [Lyngbya confervoides BDU141951]